MEPIIPLSGNPVIRIGLFNDILKVELGNTVVYPSDTPKGDLFACFLLVSVVITSRIRGDKYQHF
jgi:hypothetical protein